MPPKILYLRTTPCDPEARAALREAGDVDERVFPRPELMVAIGDYDALLIDLEHDFDEPLLSRAARLKVLATATTGLDHIDLAACERRGIDIVSLATGSGVLGTVSATAELTWGLIVALVRRMPAAMNAVLAGGAWDRESFRTYELQGKVLGVVGCGRLGSMVAHYGLAFGMTVVATDPYLAEFPRGVEPVSLPDLLRRSDIVSLHVRLSDDTRNMVGPAELEQMKDGAWLVNTARGGLVDEAALMDALERGTLRGAALDVLADEERPGREWVKDDPLVQYARSHDNLLITPHIGGATLDSKRKVNAFIARRLAEALHERLEREGQAL